MKTYFLDTAYVLALELVRDQDHKRALEHWQSIKRARFRLVTTTAVFGEIVTYFNNRGLHAKAIEVGSRLLNSGLVDVVHVDQALFDAAWSYFQTHDDKEYSFADCISFVVMTNRKLKDALTFDHHFEQAGFRRLP